jgi:hypothetical protein
MKLLLILADIGLLPFNTAFGQEVFGPWGIFPGPNPEPTDLLPDADPETVFRIGQILFEYPFDRWNKVKEPVDDLSKLQTVAGAVKASTPGPALLALAEQQLTIPHTFHFESAKVLDCGDHGFIWYMTYELFPKMGQFSGIPYQYQAVLDGRGNLIEPRLTVFDAYFHSPEEGWSYSVLQLPASPTPEDAALAPEKIRSLATESLIKVTGNADTAKAARARMKYQSQKLIRIPIAADATGTLSHVEIWSVNFRDPARKARPDELFTVWVTKDGRTADITASRLQ